MLKTSRSQQSFLNLLAFGRGAIVIVGFLVAGVTIVKVPVVAWLLLSALIGLQLFQFPAYAWVSAAVLAAVLSRWFVAIGFVPPVMNFLHFPLALGAAFVAATRGTPRSPVARFIGVGSVALLFLSFISWAFNGGEFLQPLLNWLVFLEPFLIVYALVRMPCSLSQDKFLWKLLLTISFVQFPLALWQAITLGLDDFVQGTFVDMGNGAHVVGAVTLIGILVCAAKGLSATALKRRLTWLLGGVLLFIVPVLADAKQVIVAFLPALMLIMSIFMQLRWTRFVIAFSIFASGVLGILSYYQPLQVLTNWPLISSGILGKVEASAIVVSKISDNPGGWLFGLGPANSVSRVALMGMEDYIKPNSPVSILGLSAAPTTHEIMAMTSSNWLFASSSVWSGASSWLGLVGDLGLAGLGLYLWMSWKLWQHLKGRHNWKVGVAKAVLVMAGILGAVYSWLEEPGFMLSAALVIGLGLVASEEKDASVQNLDRPQFIATGWE